MLNNLFGDRIKIERAVFLLVFVETFSQIKFFSVPASFGGAEQWVNMTNQIFYGRQDFLFSYGPLFWLMGGTATMYNAAAYWIAVLFNSTVDAFFWAIIVGLVYRGKNLILFGIAFLAFFSTLQLEAAGYLWAFMLLCYLEYAEDEPIPLGWGWLVIVGLLVGFAFYVRFFYGLLAFLTFLTYFLSRSLIYKKWAEPFFFIVSALVGYIAVGLVVFHNGSSIFSYAIINSELDFGNSVDMTYDVSNTMAGLMEAAIAILLLIGFTLLRNKVLALTVSMLAILLFKIGFSRTDHYLMYFVVPLAIVSLSMLFRGSKVGRLFYLGVLLNLGLLSTIANFPGAALLQTFRPATNFKQDFQTRMQNVDAMFKLNDDILKIIGNSTIDVYPYNNEYMFANRLNYLHRPLFQNFMTLTPKLDRYNELFFEALQRPKFVLWTGGIACSGSSCNPFDGFDQKYALNEDPLTSSTILMNYHRIATFVGVNNTPGMLMAENPTSTMYSKKEIADQPMRFGQWYAVPPGSDGVIKIIPHLKLTVLGRLRNTLFRGSVLKMTYQFASGETYQYRLNSLNAADGVWVSPLPQNFDMEAASVTAIRFDTAAKFYFKPTFNASWINVPIRSFHTAPIKYNKSLTSLPGIDVAGAHNGCTGIIDSINGIWPLPAVIDAKGVRVKGWFAAEANAGILADNIYVTLTDEHGQIIYVETTPAERPDVANAFGHPELRMSGFQSMVDLSGAGSAHYALGLAGTHDGKLIACAYAIPVDTANRGTVAPATGK